MKLKTRLINFWNACDGWVWIVILGLTRVILVTHEHYEKWEKNRSRSVAQIRHLDPNSKESKATSTLHAVQKDTAVDVKTTGTHEVVVFEPYSAFSEELFPSRILCMAGRTPTDQYHKIEGKAPIYGISGSIGVMIRNVRQGEKYTVEINADRFIGPTIESFIIIEDAPVAIMCPRINYDFASLRRNTQTSFINLSFKVQKGNQTDGPPTTRRWQVHQINDCPTQLEAKEVMHDGTITRTRIRQSSVVAGYVNENHPWIDTLLMEAKETGICNEFIGYQGGSEKIQPQIAAIWRALQNRNLSYSSVSATTSSRFHTFQHIRFLEQSISSTQANCIDGSVLLCSMLRKIGFHVGVMLVPGHAYVCVLNQSKTHTLFAIETTMLGKADLDDAIKSATETGTYSLKNFDHNSDTYELVNLTDLRKKGYQPIPFDEAAAMPALPIQPPPQTLQYQNPHEWARQYNEWARQQRIMIANRLRAQVVELESNFKDRNEESYRTRAFEVFHEIRKNQAHFNNAPNKPLLTQPGTRDGYERMQARYAEIIQTFEKISIPVNSEIDEKGLADARALAEALVELSNLPLDWAPK